MFHCTTYKPSIFTTMTIVVLFSIGGNPYSLWDKRLLAFPDTLSLVSCTIHEIPLIHCSKIDPENLVV